MKLLLDTHALLWFIAGSPDLSDHADHVPGQVAHYMLRWRLTDGSTAPWSETVSATITG